MWITNKKTTNTANRELIKDIKNIKDIDKTNLITGHMIHNKVPARDLIMSKVKEFLFSKKRSIKKV